MDTITTARRLAGPIGEFGARFMLDPATFSRSAELGLPASLASYVQGRIGVMGELDTATVIDNKLFFDEGLVAPTGRSRVASRSPKPVSPTRRSAPNVGRPTSTASPTRAARRAPGEVADSADDSEAALFAGWRDAAPPGQ
ncbi:MAG: hypothetical protein CM1200mP26_19810 [Acidimicrobiales bacterium]|nr:MAG: hypothetical protein CM1200mP26_19810 [Acidimicrobiales bacterium]